MKHISEVLNSEKYYVIVEGTRFVIGDEDAPRYPRGHGGNTFLFKLKDTGKIIYSTNVWNTGETNEPDTAEIVQYEDWASAGISKFGALTENADVYVHSKKIA